MQKRSIFRSLLSILFLFLMVQVFGQTQWEHDHKHLLGAGAGFTFIPLGDQLEDTDARGLFAPNVGLDYFYRINRR